MVPLHAACAALTKHARLPVRDTRTPAQTVSEKKIRQKLSERLGVDVNDRKATIKAAVVAFLDGVADKKKEDEEEEARREKKAKKEREKAEKAEKAKGKQRVVPRRVLVIGGGPAGLSAARHLAVNGAGQGSPACTHLFDGSLRTAHRLT